MSHIMVAGLDGSLKNFGVARMLIDLTTLQLSVSDLILVQTEKSKHKQVRASSDLYRRANELSIGVHDAITGCKMVFGEIPSGGQSYDAVIGFGIVIGTYAGIRIPLIEVAPVETKKATVGTKTASKEEMIHWAFETYPQAPWILHQKNGAGYKKGEPTNANEHLADACAVVHAGIRTPEFRTMQQLLGAATALAA